MYGWLVSFKSNHLVVTVQRTKDGLWITPTKYYALRRGIPNHIWLQIVAMTVISHCYEFN